MAVIAWAVPLLADGDTAAGAAGASAVACFLAALSGLFSWLTARDKARHDGEMVELRADVRHLTEQLAAEKSRCQDEAAEMHKEIAVLRAEVARLLALVGTNSGPGQRPPLNHPEED